MATHPDILSLIRRAQQNGVKLYVEDQTLKFRAPKRAMDDALKQAISANKAAIIAALGQQVSQFNTGLCPLSFGQRRIWTMEQLGASSQYHLSITLELSGTLDVSALQQSMDVILDRHEILRTIYLSERDKVYQLIKPALGISIPLHDLSGLQAHEQSTQQSKLIESAINKPFELSKDTLLRVDLIKLGEHLHTLVIVIHHIAADGWSLGILTREFQSLYSSFISDQQPALPTLAGQYADFAKWQQHALNENSLAEHLSYWQETLSGAPELHDLPLDLPRPDRFVSDAGQFSSVLGAELRQALKQRATENSTTLFILLETAFALFVGRWSNNSDVVIGTPVADRPRKDFEPLIGFFVNTLALRTTFSCTAPFTSVLQEKSQQWIKSLPHQSLPFEYLIEKRNPTRSLAHSPIFQVLFTLQSAHRSKLELSGLHLANQAEPLSLVKFDLELTATETESGLVLHWAYSKGLFKHATIERMAQGFKSFLTALADDPHLPVGDLPVLSNEEASQLLLSYNQTAIAYPETINLHKVFESQVEKQGGHPALIFADQCLSYRELNQRANQFAHHLIAAGIGSADCVAVHLERSVDMVVCLLGILKTGGCYMPIDTTIPVERIHFMLKDAAPRICVTQASLQANLIGSGIDITLFSDVELFAHAEHNPVLPSEPDDLAYIVYTSGSTGKPKGTLIEHRSVFNLAYSMHRKVREMGTPEKASWASNASFSFDAFVQSFSQLMFGFTLHLIPEKLRRDPDALIGYFEQHELSVFDCTPTQFNLLLERLARSRKVLSQIFVLGGELVNGEMWKRINDLSAKSPFRVLNVYGPTECTINSSFVAVEPKQLPSIGFAIDNTELYVLDENLQPLPHGVAGELFIGGDGLARGYLNRPELTAEKFIANPFAEKQRLYRTGDLVRYQPDGSLEYLGRLDDQIKLRGFRVELGEIEQTLETVEGVIQAVCIAFGEGAQKYIAAYLATEKSTDTATVTSLCRSALTRTLPEYMHPTSFTLLDAIPLSANGKVDKFALPSPSNGVPDGEPKLAPRNRIERTLCEIWCQVLGKQDIGILDNFFDIGGNSILAVTLQQEINKTLDSHISVSDIFELHSIKKIASFLADVEKPETETSNEQSIVPQLENPDNEIAIVGYASRFPDADSVEAFWHNIANGVESLRTFSDDELRQTGTSQALLENPHFVKKGVLLDDIDKFDAGFFGFTPREAELIDPQQRLLFECAQQALELAGYGDRSGPRQVGVFCGVMDSHYLTEHIMPTQQTQGRIDPTVMHANSSAYSATRLAYKLNLQGPSINVVTACSTSLVAVHQACVSLQRGECQMALAGGAAVNNLQPSGYLYQEGGIASPDGHCRTFDQQARGTRGGDGAGLVLLKPLSQAIQDGDTIHAVIKGSAVNNDGADKVGYTAPSVAGQTDVIRRAQHAAGVTPESIQYVEAHGTGTRLGDPIEIKALNNAFGAAQTPYCAIGSVKTNIGHLDAAAGIAGLLKTVQALKHKQLPPSLNFSQPNPNIPFEGSAFYVNTALKPWPETDTPRRAAVSSFGIGGTNAHVVLEQAPAVPSGEIVPGHHPLLLSARSRDALEQQVQQLQQHLQDNPSLALQDVAFTLQAGRTPLPYRLALTADSIEQAQQALAQATLTDNPVSAPEHIVMLFPGQGSQYLAMAHSLYEQPGLFRDTLAHCAEILTPLLECDLIDLLYHNDDPQQLLQTRFAQPALFAIEYSLAKQLIDLGLKPDIMIGHSLGEYVAACLAGVFSLEQALTLIVARANLMQQANPGSMLAVACERDTLEPYLQRCNCDLAAVNGPQSCVAAGTEQDIETLAQLLSKQDIPAQTLRTSHAFHSRMMAPVLEPLAKVLANINLQAPNIPYLSNLTGQMITDQQATSVDYWLQHLRHTVAFHDGLRTLAAIPELDVSRTLMIEVGPGQTLLALARKQPALLDACKLDTLGRQPSPDGAQQIFTQCLANAWAIGCRINWHKLHRRHSRVPLPTYPFQRQRYWLDRPAQTSETTAILPSAPQGGARLFELCWQARVSTNQAYLLAESTNIASFFVLDNGSGLTESLCQQLAGIAGKVSRYPMSPGLQSDFSTQIKQLCEAISRSPGKCLLLHSLNFGAVAYATRAEEVIEGIFTLLKAIDEAQLLERIELKLLMSDGLRVLPDDQVTADYGCISGAVLAIRAEYPQLQCQCIDFPAAETACSAQWARFRSDMSRDRDQALIAYRHGIKWLRNYQPLKAVDNTQQDYVSANGVYLITGGTGGIGLTLARHLAGKQPVKLVLCSRKKVIDKSQWSTALGDPAVDDTTRSLLQNIIDIQAMGSEVLCVSADISQPNDVKDLLDTILSRFGRLPRGVIHAAGIPGGGLLSLKSKDTLHQVLAPKITGTRLLLDALQEADLDFFVNFSSMASLFSAPGQFDYAAANAYQDAVSSSLPGKRRKIKTINWDSWKEVGMAASADVPEHMRAAHAAQLEQGLCTPQALEAFDRIMSQDLIQVMVTNHTAPADNAHQVPQAATNDQQNVPEPSIFEAEKIEQVIASLWFGLLGVEVKDADADFFELGGDSLLLAKLTAQINDKLGMNLSIRSTFEHTGFSSLTDYIKQALALRPGESPPEQEDVVEEGFI